jgi:hypothetical protein
MEDTRRTTKLIVVADESGNILSALWPGVQSEGAPTETGISLSTGRVAHEVEVPEELYQLARPNLADYYLRLEERELPVIMKRSDNMDA